MSRFGETVSFSPSTLRILILVALFSSVLAGCERHPNEAASEAAQVAEEPAEEADAGETNDSASDTDEATDPVSDADESADATSATDEASDQSAEPEEEPPPEVQVGSWEGSVDSMDQIGEADYSSPRLLSVMRQSTAEAVLAPSGLASVEDVVDPFLVSRDLEIAGQGGEDLFVVMSEERSDGTSQSVFGRFFSSQTGSHIFFGVSPEDAPYFEFTIGPVEFMTPAPGAPPDTAIFAGLTGGGPVDIDFSPILTDSAEFYESFQRNAELDLAQESIVDLGWLHRLEGTLEAPQP